MACPHNKDSDKPGHPTSQISLQPIYTSRLFHCYMLDESICHFRDVRSILCYSVLLANSVDPDQMPHNVASDLGLHFLLMTLLRVSR